MKFNPDFTKPISVEEIHLLHAYFTWSQETVGFGELNVKIREGKIFADTENMGKEWTRRALYVLADKIVEEAFDENGKAKP